MVSILSKFQTNPFLANDRPSWIEIGCAVGGVASLTLASYVVVNIAKALKKKWRDEEALKDFPGPPAHWLWGTFFKMPKGTGIYKIIEWIEKYDGRMTLQSGPFLKELHLSHPDYIKAIYNTAEPKDPFIYSFIKQWLGDGLLISKGQKWARNRRLLTPAFHFDILKPYQALFSSCANTLGKKWSSEGDDDEWRCVNIFDNISVMTLDSLMRCIFGIETNFITDKKKNPYIKAVYDLSDLVIERARYFPHHSNLLYYFSINGYRWRRALGFVHGFTRDVIQQRKREKEAGKSTNGKYRNFIDILIDCRDTDGNGLSDQEIQDEVDTFMFEGHDTTASGLSWCLYNMARHPHYQDKCREEINSVLGDRDMVTWEDLQSLSYLTMCIKESLRLHPPVPGTGRWTTKEITFHDGKKIPAGIWLAISINGCHHNPKVWPQPEVYNPERFSPENSADRHPHAFIPFSAGPRNCIGQHFAMNEMKTCMAVLLKKFEFLEDGSRPVQKSPELILRAKDPGMFLKIKPIL